MNTTTITINWHDYEGFRSAIQAIGRSTLNTFTVESDLFSIKAVSARSRYSAERQLEAMEFFGCVSEPSKSKRSDSMLICHTRFLIWRYCWAKFDVTTTQIASITKHSRSNVSLGLKKISILLENEDIKRLRNEVYEKCDQIFV